MGSFLALSIESSSGAFKGTLYKSKKTNKGNKRTSKVSYIKNMFKAGRQGQGDNTDSKANIEID